MPGSLGQGRIARLVAANRGGVADAAVTTGRPAAPPAARAAAIGDPAVTRLFRAHHLELVRLALMMTGDLATAEDVVQDVFERLYRRWPSSQAGPGGGLAYVRASVLNGCRSAHRRAAVRRLHADRLAAHAVVTVPDTAAGVAARGAVAAALRRLPPRQREVLILRYYCDLDTDEIAASLRIGPSSVRSAISRGLAALARIIGEEER